MSDYHQVWKSVLHREELAGYSALAGFFRHVITLIYFFNKYEFVDLFVCYLRASDSCLEI